MFFFFLLFQISINMITEVIFDENNEWINQELSCLNCTYKISSIKKNFVYVSVQLQVANPYFFLGAQEFDAISNVNFNLSVDKISVLENRKSRFLKINQPNLPLFITTIDLQKSSQFSITIQDSSSLECDSNCSQNGICSINGCICFDSYIGSNCNQIAQKLIEDDNQIYFIQEEAKYFYINQSQFEGETLQLKINTENNEVLKLYFQKSSAYILPDSIYFNDDLVDVLTVTDSQPVIKKFEVQNLNESNSLIVFIAISQNQNLSTIANKICIYLLTKTDDTDNSLLIGAVLGPVLTAIIIIIICFIRKRQLGKNSRIQIQDGEYPTPNQNQLFFRRAKENLTSKLKIIKIQISRKDLHQYVQFVLINYSMEEKYVKLYAIISFIMNVYQLGVKNILIAHCVEQISL